MENDWREVLSQWATVESIEITNRTFNSIIKSPDLSSITVDNVRDKYGYIKIGKSAVIFSTLFCPDSTVTVYSVGSLPHSMVKGMGQNISELPISFTVAEKISELIITKNGRS